MRRTFSFVGEQSEDGFIVHDREEVREALLDLEGALFRLGGVVSISAVRRQVGDDAFQTIGMALVYESFAPAHKEREDAAAEPAA